MARSRNAKPEPESEPEQSIEQIAADEQARVEEAEAKRPRNGKEGKHGYMSMVERIRLAERIAIARTKLKPDTWAVIAERENVPVRTCKYTYEKFRGDSIRLGDGTGRAVLNETLLLYTESIERLSWESEFGDTSAARVGAMRTLFDGLKGRIELLALTGRMPRSFRAVDELAALHRIVRRMAEVVEVRGLPPEVVADFVEIAREIQPLISGDTEPIIEGAARARPAA